MTIIHHAISEPTSALEPFLAIPDLDLEHRSPTGMTMLLTACARASSHSAGIKVSIKNSTLINHFIDRGADVFAIDNKGRGALHHLIESSKRAESHELLQTLAENNPALIHVRDNEGYTPLHYTLRSKMWNAARLLANAGADLLDNDPQGNTALHWLSCTSKGPQHELFVSCISLGISINSRNNAGLTPLATFLSTIDFLKDRSYDEDDSSWISKTLTIFEDVFVRNGADLLSKDNEGKGLLHIIAKQVAADDQVPPEGIKNLQEMFRVLVAKGLDPWMEDEGQMTPLDVAAVCGNDAILKMFRRDK